MCFDSNPYSSSIREMLTTFGTSTYKVGLKVHPNEQDTRVPIMCWGSCSYTIQSIGQYAHISFKTTNSCVRFAVFTELYKGLVNNIFACWKRTILCVFVFFLLVFCTERLLVDEEKPLFGSLPCRQV